MPTWHPRASPAGRSAEAASADPRVELLLQRIGAAQHELDGVLGAVHDLALQVAGSSDRGPDPRAARPRLRSVGPGPGADRTNGAGPARPGGARGGWG